MELEKALRELPVARKAQRLRQLWPLIEARLAAGVSHAEMLEFLNRNGFDLTERTYKSYLYRHRKKNRTRSPGDRPKGGGTAAQARIDLAKQPRSGNEDPRRPPTFDYDPRGIPDLLK